MKKIVAVVVVLCLLLVGCNNLNDNLLFDKRGNGSLPLSFWITPNNYEVVTIAERFKSSNRELTVYNLYSFVTSLNYIVDLDDFWQKPEETLNRGGGDCEDLSFLLASLMASSDVKGVYIAMGVSRESVMIARIGSGHMWVEYRGKAYETTLYTLPFDKEAMDNRFHVVNRILVR